MKKTYIIFILLFIPIRIFPQSGLGLNDLIESYCFQDKAKFKGSRHALVKEIKSFPIGKILKKTESYQSNKSIDIRRMAFQLIYELAVYEKDTLNQQIFIEKLTEGNYFVVGNENWTDNLKQFKRNQFNSKARQNFVRYIQKEFSDTELKTYKKYISGPNKESIVKIYKNHYKQENLDKKVIRKNIDSIGRAEDKMILQSITGRLPGKDEIMLIGFLNLRELVPFLEDLLADQNIKDLNVKWAAHLALARMGKDYEIQYCLGLIKKPPVSDQMVYDLAPDLVYLRQKEAIDYLVDILNNNEENCLTANPESKDMILCGYRIMEYLAPVIENFPLKTNASGDIETNNYESALLIARKWFDDQDGNFKIIDDSF